MSNLNQKLDELQVHLTAIAKVYQELRQLSTAPSDMFNFAAATGTPAAFQMAPVPAGPVADAPHLNISFACWKKAQSLSGSIKISNGQQLVAEYRTVLFPSKPNSNAMVLNGYIIPKEQSEGQLSEINVGGVFVYNKDGALSAQFKIDPTQVNDLFQFDCVLSPVTKTNPNQPDLEGKCEVHSHFYSMAVRAQMQQQVQQPYQQQPDILSGLFPSDGGPSDGGILSNPMSDLQSLLG